MCSGISAFLFEIVRGRSTLKGNFRELRDEKDRSHEAERVSGKRRNYARGRVETDETIKKLPDVLVEERKKWRAR